MCTTRYLLVAAALAAIAAVSAAAPEDGLVAYWDFDENGGGTANDRSGNGHDGELVGDPEWVEGAFGSALRFDEALEYVLVPHDDALNFTNAVTFALFFRPDDVLASRRLMVSPIPVPSIFDASRPRRENGRNTSSRLSAGMPDPVSLMLIRAVPLLVSAAATVIVPLS